MKTLSIVPGTPEWHAHRAEHFNASDAPVMLGVSPHKTRTQFMRERKTQTREMAGAPGSTTTA